MAKLKKTKDTVQTKPSSTPRALRASNRNALKAKQNEIKKLQSKVKKVNKQIKQQIVREKKDVLSFDAKQFRKGIEALLLYDEKETTKDLFTREKPIFLQVEAIRIPKCPNRQIRLPLKHTLLTEKQEVCLFVPDLKKGRRLDHEPTIEHYEDLLRSKNVQSIKRIIPIHQLKVEYDQFELKRRLCGYYDHFLVEGNISGHVFHLLGKTFIDKRKVPVPVNLQKNNLCESIEKALRKVSLHLHDHGTSFTIQFGHTEMTIDQLTDNLVSVSKILVEKFPGGGKNIRALYIKTDKSIAIPIYYTLKSANRVNVPVIKPLRPNYYEKVSGELTTKILNSEVTVHPGGRIEYEKKTTGISKNQLRKIRQGKVQKRSAKLRAKAQRSREKKKKIKTDVKQELKKEKTAVKIKNEGSESVAKKNKKKKPKKKAENQQMTQNAKSVDAEKSLTPKNNPKQSIVASKQLKSTPKQKSKSSKRNKVENQNNKSPLSGIVKKRKKNKKNKTKKDVNKVANGV